MTATKRKPPRPPTREETDASADRRLAKAAGWVQAEDLDELQVDLHKETTYEFELLRYAVRQDPRAKTPGVAERLDQLRRDLREQMAELGLTPAARKALGVASGTSLGAQNRTRSVEDVVLAYRRPADHRALLKELVRTGLWDAIGTELKREIEEEQETTDGQTETNATPRRPREPAQRPQRQRVAGASAERRSEVHQLRPVSAGEDQ